MNAVDFRRDVGIDRLLDRVSFFDANKKDNFLLVKVHPSVVGPFIEIVGHSYTNLKIMRVSQEELRIYK